jgi:hypothetical protein
MWRLVLAGALAACGDNGSAAPDAALPDAAPDAAVPLAFVTGPTFTLAPNPSTPLAGRLELSTNRPTRVSLAISDADRAFTVELGARSAAHVAPVLGFGRGPRTCSRSRSPTTPVGSSRRRRSRSPPRRCRPASRPSRRTGSRPRRPSPA